MPDYNIKAGIKKELERGDVVTLEYDNCARRDIPINPKINRIREDTTWEEVLSDFENSTPQNNMLNSMHFFFFFSYFFLVILFYFYFFYYFPFISLLLLLLLLFSFFS